MARQIGRGPRLREGGGVDLASFEFDMCLGNTLQLGARSDVGHTGPDGRMERRDDLAKGAMRFAVDRRGPKQRCFGDERAYGFGRNFGHLEHR